jgi:hypothetical protein
VRASRAVSRVISPAAGPATELLRGIHDGVASLGDAACAGDERLGLQSVQPPPLGIARKLHLDPTAAVVIV